MRYGALGMCCQSFEFYALAAKCWWQIKSHQCLTSFWPSVHLTACLVRLLHSGPSDITALKENSFGSCVPCLPRSQARVVLNAVCFVQDKVQRLVWSIQLCLGESDFFQLDLLTAIHRPYKRFCLVCISSKAPLQQGRPL